MLGLFTGDLLLSLLKLVGNLLNGFSHNLSEILAVFVRIPLQRWRETRGRSGPCASHVRDLEAKTKDHEFNQNSTLL